MTRPWKATHVIVDDDGDEREQVMLVNGWAVTRDVWEQGGRWWRVVADAAGQLVLAEHDDHFVHPLKAEASP